jgi:hypothetical protein
MRTDLAEDIAARTLAAERLALAALVAMERMSMALRQESALDRLADELDGLEPATVETLTRDLRLQRRSTEIMAQHVVALQDRRDRAGRL